MKREGNNMENEYNVEETEFGTRTSHPAYGTIMFNRAYGYKRSLFGSSIEHKNVIKMSELTEKELKTVNKHLNRCRNPYFKYNQSRNLLNNTYGEMLSGPSIKDMPTFDPDAEVTELTLTIPTWNSSIKRTQTNADLSIISQTAREKLKSALQSLRDEVDIMLTLIKEEK